MNNTTLTTASPASQGFVMPGEWDKHKRTWMAWPKAENDLWLGRLEEVEKSYADVANTIAEFEPVAMVVSKETIDRARSLCGESIMLLELGNDDSWMRDIGPSFLKHTQTGEVAGTDWRFNCWGGYVPRYQEDAQVAGRVLNHLDMQTYNSCLVMEGGALHVDGEGTLITTESVVLNKNRNWGMNKTQAEIELCRATGATKIIWLPGDPNDLTGDMTDGHVDGIVSYIKPGMVMFEKDPTSEGEWAELEDENRRVLELETDAKGRKFEIIDLEVDHSNIGQDYDLFCSSYINYYLTNGGVVMPSYGVDSDQQVKDLFISLFPDREVVMVDINPIAIGGGGIHCITQQEPV